ncbi:MAG: YHS domain-containing protein [Candidatus Omnitrophica bacterium]|nr:YHS domain-containing protein [Candidatus Omnitrophota bacterium]
MKLFIMISLILSIPLSSVSAQPHSDSDAGHHMDMEKMENEEVQQKGDLGICPVMGGEAKKQYSHTYQGKTYYFCCPACIGKFKENPEKYISKIKEFKVEAYQFGYQPQEIKVKKGDIVRIIATSRDVPHGFSIKDYNINVVLKKGQEKKIEFIADQAGKFPIICSVYCGRGHHQMKAKLIVE